MGQIFSGPNESEISEKVLQERESESEFSEKVSKTFAVAAIDIGTTFSGYAFSFKHDFLKDPTRVLTKHWKSTSGEIQSNKTPTCILFNQNNEFHSFGYEAEDAYADKLLENANDASRWSFFRSFKMTLYDQADLHEGFLLESTNGNTLPALTVFAESIRYMKDVMLEHCMEKTIGITMEDIAWVVTVPAIWSDPAKKFMRLAAENAGIQTDRLTLALEPEAAALYVRHIPFERPNERILPNQNAFKDNMLVKIGPGERYMVVDAGGGTVDIVVHEMREDGKIREIYKANGGDWGGTRVNKAFEDFLVDLVSPETTNDSNQNVNQGREVLKSFRKNFPLDDLELKRSFERKKGGIYKSMKSKVTMSFPVNLKDTFYELNPDSEMKLFCLGQLSSQVKHVHGKLQISPYMACSFFKDPIDNIVNHLRQIFNELQVEGAEKIIMVGGFSECPMLVSAIRNAFPGKSIVVPEEDAGLAVLKGAVIFGHDSKVLTERVSKTTYGVRCEAPFNKDIHPQQFKYIDQDGNEWCHNVFDIHLKAGEVSRVGEPFLNQEYYLSPLVKDGSFTFSVFGTEAPEPKFVTDHCVRKLGEACMIIPPEDVDFKSKIKVSLYSSGTELEAELFYRKTGQKERSFIGYLDKL